MGVADCLRSLVGNRFLGRLRGAQRMLGRLAEYAWVWAVRVALGRHRAPLGQRGERLAARYLRRQGIRIVAHQLRTSWGEIDLIGVDRRTVVFVEVKTRGSHQRGTPEESVTADKQRRLTQLALAYLRRNELLECAARFDVIAVTWPRSGRLPKIRHIKHAFQPDARFQMFA